MTLVDTSLSYHAEKERHQENEQFCETKNTLTHPCTFHTSEPPLTNGLFLRPCMVLRRAGSKTRSKRTRSDETQRSEQNKKMAPWIRHVTATRNEEESSSEVNHELPPKGTTTMLGVANLNQTIKQLTEKDTHTRTHTHTHTHTQTCNT